MKVIIQGFFLVCISFGVKKFKLEVLIYFFKNCSSYSIFNLLNSFAINSPIILEPTGSVCIPS